LRELQVFPVSRHFIKPTKIGFFLLCLVSHVTEEEEEEEKKYSQRHVLPLGPLGKHTWSALHPPYPA